MNLKEYNLYLCQQPVDSIEEALRQLMQSKRDNPGSVVFMFPDSDEKNDEWDEKGIGIRTSHDYSNVPYIDCTLFEDYCDDNPESHKNALKMNEQEYIEFLVAEIRKHLDISDVDRWTFAAIDVDDDYNILLYIAGKYWPEVKKMVKSFNEKNKNEGYAPLNVNDATMTVEGVFSARHPEGGFLKKRRIRKQNKSYEKDLLEFLDSLHEYLELVP